MLPKPADLHKRARFYREAASHASGDDTKRSLAAYGLALEQIADSMLLDEDGTKTELHERQLADSEKLVAAFSINAAEMNSQISAWRTKAEELRATAEN